MSLELTRLKKEVRIYKVLNCPFKDEYIVRTVYRDMSTSSYKWKLEVSYCEFLDTDDELPVIFGTKNYTRDTLQRRFKEWLEKRDLIVELFEVRQFFLPKSSIVV